LSPLRSEIDVPSGSPARIQTPAPGDARLERLAINQWTVRSLGVREVVELCVRLGVPAVGLWREQLAEIGAAQADRLLREVGVRVSSLCRAGFVAGIEDPRAWRTALDDNRAAIEEAAEIGTDVLVFVAGGLAPGSRDLAGARGRVSDALDALAPFALDHGVTIALEPLHPMYCADRAVISTLDQALRMASPYPESAVGVVVDTFHVWWDPEVLGSIDRAAGRIAAFQVCDWITPLPADPLLARGMMGDGHIDFGPLVDAVLAAGYTGDIEVEIFNQEVWDADPEQVVRTAMRRFAELVAPRP